MDTKQFKSSDDFLFYLHEYRENLRSEISTHQNYLNRIEMLIESYEETVRMLNASDPNLILQGVCLSVTWDYPYSKVILKSWKKDKQKMSYDEMLQSIRFSNFGTKNIVTDDVSKLKKKILGLPSYKKFTSSPKQMDRLKIWINNKISDLTKIRSAYQDYLSFLTSTLNQADKTSDKINSTYARHTDVDKVVSELDTYNRIFEDIKVLEKEMEEEEKETQDISFNVTHQIQREIPIAPATKDQLHAYASDTVLELQPLYDNFMLGVNAVNGINCCDLQSPTSVFTERSYINKLVSINVRPEGNIHSGWRSRKNKEESYESL